MNSNRKRNKKMRDRFIRVEIYLPKLTPDLELLRRNASATCWPRSAAPSTRGCLYRSACQDPPRNLGKSEQDKIKMFSLKLKHAQHYGQFTPNSITLSLAYNEFGYNEHPADFFASKIMDCSVEKFGYNEHPLIANSFFCIFSLIVSQTQCIVFLICFI